MGDREAWSFRREGQACQAEAGGWGSCLSSNGKFKSLAAIRDVDSAWFFAALTSHCESHQFIFNPHTESFLISSGDMDYV
jgi:hypothetical protein